MMTMPAHGSGQWPFAAVPFGTGHLRWEVPSLPDFGPPAFAVNSGRPAGPASYRRLYVYRDERLELHGLAWHRGGASLLHGHGPATAVYWVQSGLLEEERYLVEGDSYRYETCLLRPGERSVLPPH